MRLHRPKSHLSNTVPELDINQYKGFFLWHLESVFQHGFLPSSTKGVKGTGDLTLYESTVKFDIKRCEGIHEQLVCPARSLEISRL